MIDFTCDMNCPTGIVGLKTAMCCERCRTSRKYYVNDENRQFWTDDKGFLGEDGCRLPREQVPPECKKYNCKENAFYIYYTKVTPVVWDGEKWKALTVVEKCFVADFKDMNIINTKVNDDIESYLEKVLENDRT